MKTFSTLLILLLTLAVSCQRQSVIDETFPWPSSGIEEADSLLLAYEHHRNYNSLPDKSKIVEKLDSIHKANPDNELIKLRLNYLKCCNRFMNESNSSIIDNILTWEDSINYPYDWHMFMTLKVKTEFDLAKRYNIIMDNLSYFKKVKARIEEGRNLIFIGNIMAKFLDTINALNYYNQALSIFTDLSMSNPALIVKNNIAILSTTEFRDSMYKELVENYEGIRNQGYFALILQNTFIDFNMDSLFIIEKAIELYQHNNMDRETLPIAMALKAKYYIKHNQPRRGIEILWAAMDSANKFPSNVLNFKLIDDALADAYYYCGEKDSSIAEFERARVWRDSLDKIYNRPKVYALDAKARIEMAERTAKLERERIIGLWIISVLCLATIVGLLISYIKRKNVEKKHEEILIEEKIQRQIQSIQAQAKVMEENDRLMEEITEKIEELKNSNNISEEGADNLGRVLRIHKSNEDNRQGFLKVQKELDSRFLIKLKEDYPVLSESQLKLASLIAVGLDSRQIGSILNIEQASVHKSRYRLRTRIGLKTDESLEEFLRRYNRSLPIDQ